jgi:hypothetical protein
MVLAVELTGVILFVFAMVLLAVGVPMTIVFTVLASFHRKPGPRTWRDRWGFNPNNLIFFPDRLDERGQIYAKRARYGIKLALFGAACGFLAAFTGI